MVVRNGASKELRRKCFVETTPLFSFPGLDDWRLRYASKTQPRFCCVRPAFVRAAAEAGRAVVGGAGGGACSRRAEHEHEQTPLPQQRLRRAPRPPR